MEILHLLLLLLLLLVSLLLLLLPFLKTQPKQGFLNLPLLGILPSFILNRHRFLDWTASVLRRSPTHTAFLSRPGGVRGILTANPANVQHMLKTNFHNYPKGPRFIGLLQDFLGNGIFNSDGESWKVQRKTASFEFSTKSLRSFGMETAAEEVTGRLVPILRRAAEEGRVLDLQDVLERFAFDNICKVAFNVDPGCLGGDGTVGAEFMQAFEEAATLSSQRFLQVIPPLHRIKRYFNIGSERRLKYSIAIVHQFADKIIKSRMEQRSEKRDEDLLSRFIGSGSENSVEFLRDIVISFLLAGRDTTSSALSWFFWQLSSLPDVEKKILEELRSIRIRNGKNLGEMYSYDELREMTYLHAAISESMRLYPPVPVDSKVCLEDDVFPDGTFIGKGWFASYFTHAMGRMVSIWGEDCCEFKPERWIEDGAIRLVSPYQYPVFHAGPRICLGKDMAYIQMKLIVASMLERFVIDVQDKDKCPEHVLSLTLRMKGGLTVTVRERCNDLMD